MGEYPVLTNHLALVSLLISPDGIQSAVSVSTKNDLARLIRHLLPLLRILPYHPTQPQRLLPATQLKTRCPAEAKHRRALVHPVACPTNQSKAPHHARGRLSGECKSCR